MTLTETVSEKDTPPACCLLPPQPADLQQLGLQQPSHRAGEGCRPAGSSCTGGFACPSRAAWPESERQVQDLWGTRAALREQDVGLPGPAADCCGAAGLLPGQLPECHAHRQGLCLLTAQTRPP